MNTTIIAKAQVELNNIRLSTIGLFKDIGGAFHLVQKVNKSDKYVTSVDTVRITEFGAIHRNFGLKADRGTLALIEDYESLHDLLKNPYEYVEFYNKHFKDE